MSTFRVEEFDTSTAGIRFGFGIDGEKDNPWLEVDDHRCAMGTTCIAQLYDQPKAIGIVLQGEYDQPVWETPWQVFISDPFEREPIYVCEDCSAIISDVLTKVGFTEVTS